MGGAGSSLTSAPLLRLSYTSKLAVPDEGEADRIISNIIASANKNNPLTEISGILYWDRSSNAILQTLEGPEKAVRALYATIAADSRHTEIKQVGSLRTRQRQHGDFGMVLWCSKAEPDGHFTPPCDDPYVRVQYRSTLVAQNMEEARNLLVDIVAVSTRNNSAYAIGGLLLFNQKSLGVVQMLEGRQSAVAATLSKIYRDERHMDMRTTGVELLASAEFLFFDASWGMLMTEVFMENLWENAPDMQSLSARINRALGKGELQQAKEERRQLILKAVQQLD